MLASTPTDNGQRWTFAVRAFETDSLIWRQGGVMPQANFHLSEAIMKINDNESQIIWTFHQLGNFGLHLLFAQKVESRLTKPKNYYILNFT